MQTTIRHATFDIPDWANHSDLPNTRSKIDTVISRYEGERKRRGPMPFAEFTRMAAECLNLSPAATDEGLIRQGLSTWSIDAAFSGLIGQSFHDGYTSSPNTLDGIYQVQPCESFLPQVAMSQWQGARLTQTGRGAAESMYLGLGGQAWGVVRYGATAEIDEQDLVDSVSLDLLTLAANEMGRAAKRIIGDLLWSLLLSNPTLADEVACFHALHNNLGGAFGQSEFDAAFGAIGKQVMTDQDGAPIHLNAFPSILVTAPGIYGSAAREMGNLWHGPIENEVRSESRLTTVGVVNPQTDEMVAAATDSAWLLAAPASTIPCLVLGALDGSLEPTIRVAPFGKNAQVPAGRWGWTMDCKLDIGAALTNFRGLYFGAGA